MRVDVPVQVPFTCLGQAQREGGLADLPGAGNEHHLAVQVGKNLACEVAVGDGHPRNYTAIFDLSRNSQMLFFTKV